MANGNFIVQNGLTVGAVTIFAGNGDIITSGNLTSAQASASFDSINNTPIGNSAPSTGAFTTLNATSFVNTGTSTATNYTASGTVIASTVNAGTIGNVGATHIGSNVSVPNTLTSIGSTSNFGQLNVGGAINYGPDYGLVGSFVANIPNYAYVAVQNLNTGGNASASFTAYNNTGTSYIDVGINSSNFNASSSGFVNNSVNAPNASYAYAYGGEMVIGTWNNNGIHFITDAASTAGDSMFIAGNGNVYISGNLTVSGQQSQYTTITTFLTESANLVSTAYLAGNASTNSGTITQQNTMVPSGTINLGSGSAYYSNAYATNIYGTLQTAAQTNITSVGTLSGLTVSAAIVPNANASVNLGSSGAWWATIYGTATHAQYADLAENYQADKAYTAGTVVMFGGSAEVTLADADTTRVAGVVSTNPAHLMNGGLTGANVVPLALQGRVPCMVIGPVAKGDLMVSAGFGYAKVNNNPQCGQVIGKALQDVTFAGKAVIEVVVGRV